MQRRDFIQGAIAAGLLASSGARLRAAESVGAPRVLIFTKHLQFISDYAKMSATAAELGFDGLELAVRKGGHVEPQNVARDLPRAVEAARASGAPVGMITTEIEKADAKDTVAILETAAAQGIRFYRIGGPNYDADRPIKEQMDEMRAKLAGLAELNAKLGVCATYQNHSGTRRIGAPVWDLCEMMEGTDPEFMAIDFDLGHATIEGGNAWELHWRRAEPRVKAVTIKDFAWQKNSKGEWRAEWCPVGEGMIQTKKLFTMMKEAGFSGPITSHYEYDPKPSDGQSKEDALLATMRRDAKTLKDYLKEVSWS